MKFRSLAVAVAGLALVALLPSASKAQSAAESASIQASVTVLAPSVQPSVRIERSGDAGGEPSVAVEGAKSWAVRVEVGEEGHALAPEPGPGGRLTLSASDWATLARTSGRSPIPVRVVLAAY
jgi:hypothetical protein